MVLEFVARLNELRNVVFERLLTTPLEMLQIKEFMEDVQSNTANADAAIDDLGLEFSELVNQTEQMVLLSSGSLFEISYLELSRLNIFFETS